MGKLKKVSLEEAKAQFEELLEELLAGKSVSISKEGEPAVDLSLKEADAAIEQKQQRKRVEFGKFTGSSRVPSDEEWAEMDRDIARDFEKSQLFPE